MITPAVYIGIYIAPSPYLSPGKELTSWFLLTSVLY